MIIRRVRLNFFHRNTAVRGVEMNVCGAHTPIDNNLFVTVCTDIVRTLYEFSKVGRRVNDFSRLAKSS